ncbi:hypothetical protein [Bailinhaonella thermotolerans]|nr:hypothetical protein [Bailinhaonella thermotolerans]
MAAEYRSMGCMFRHAIFLTPASAGAMARASVLSGSFDGAER